MIPRLAIGALAAAALLASSMAAGTMAQAQTYPATPGSQHTGQSGYLPQPSAPGGTPSGAGVTTAGPSMQGSVPNTPAGAAIPGSSSLGFQQFPTSGGQYGPGGGTPRLPNQNCGGLGSCAWGSQGQPAASCTLDLRYCTSVSSGPLFSTTTCSVQGTLNTCATNDLNGTATATNVGLPGSGTPAGSAYPATVTGTTLLPGTASTGVATSSASR
jgi:hypothetical protein